MNYIDRLVDLLDGGEIDRDKVASVRLEHAAGCPGGPGCTCGGVIHVQEFEDVEVGSE